ncbi:hypothetical protein, partial [Oceanobacillus profundus]
NYCLVTLILSKGVLFVCIKRAVLTNLLASTTLFNYWGFVPASFGGTNVINIVYAPPVQKRIQLYHYTQQTLKVML